MAQAVSEETEPVGDGAVKYRWPSIRGIADWVDETGLPWLRKTLTPARRLSGGTTQGPHVMRDAERPARL